MRFLKLLGATAGLLTLGATAFAQDVTITYQLNFPVDTFNVHYTRGDGSKATALQHLAVPFTATITDPVGSPSFTVYCVDLQHGVVSPTTSAVTPVNVPVANPNDLYDPGTAPLFADRLPGTFLELEEASWLILNETPPGQTKDQGAALQAAIWAIIDGNTSFTVNNTSDKFYITDDGLGQGNFATIVSEANAYLAGLQSQLGLGGFNGLANGVLYNVDRAIAGNVGQDMLSGPAGPRPIVPPTVTPEGASLLLFLPGLIPVAIGLRRRRNNKPSGE